MPECAYVADLNEHLEEAGVRHSCIELTRRLGHGDPRHLRPMQTAEGPVLWPIDRVLVDLAWGLDGYPSRSAYRDHHALTAHHHRVFANDGEPYDRERARVQVASDAAESVERVRERTADGGIAVCAFDTELFGHWWYEGVEWLADVVDEAERQGLVIVELGDATAERHAPVAAPDDLGASSWGAENDLSTWSGPRVAQFAWDSRSSELAVLATGSRPSDRALRELLALQASDWAFLHAREMAGDYPRERANGHLDELRRALAPQPGGADQDERPSRNLAPVLAGWEG